MRNRISYPAGTLIFRQGYPGEHAYVIEQGEVEIFHEMPDGREEPVALLLSGQMFGEMALTDDAPRTASARAKTDVVLQIMEI